MSAPSFNSMGPHTVLVRWKAEISETIHARVMQFQDFVLREYSNQIIETVPAYQSLAIFLTSEILASSFIKELQDKIVFKNTSESQKTSLFKIPVCYCTPYALDMISVASHTGLDEAAIISLHTKSIYNVYFIGFLPGFPYLGGLSKSLHIPRKRTPRPRLEAGSVGIGGAQTGVYPQDSPGGWQIIGKTPIALFRNQESLLKAGDKVQFERITQKEFQEISEATAQGTYTPKKIDL